MVVVVAEVDVVVVVVVEVVVVIARAHHPTRRCVHSPSEHFAFASAMPDPPLSAQLSS